MQNAGLSNAARIALAMYEGEPCRICGKPITSAADAVFVGYSKDNTARAAHHDCAMNITEIVERQRQWIEDLQSGQYVNCVYCGHQYGPEDETPVSRAELLKRHVQECPEHPMAELREALVWICNLCLTHIEHATQDESFRSLAGRVYGKALQALGEL